MKLDQYLSDFESSPRDEEEYDSRSPEDYQKFEDDEEYNSEEFEDDAEGLSFRGKLE